jgi:hypothetical protein
MPQSTRDLLSKKYFLFIEIVHFASGASETMDKQTIRYNASLIGSGKDC